MKHRTTLIQKMSTKKLLTQITTTHWNVIPHHVSQMIPRQMTPGSILPVQFHQPSLHILSFKQNINPFPLSYKCFSTNNRSRRKRLSLRLKSMYRKIPTNSTTDPTTDPSIDPSIDPSRDQVNPDYEQLPKTFHEWKKVFQKTHIDYLNTFEGFLDNHTIGSETRKNVIPNESESKSNTNISSMNTITDHKNIKKQMDTIRNNLDNNIQTIQEEGQTLIHNVKEKTGLKTKDDLRNVATSMMSLATECISHFIKGYKEGRDQEVDRVLHQYFQDQNNEKNEQTQTQTKQEQEHEQERKLFRKRRRKRLRI